MRHHVETLLSLEDLRIEEALASLEIELPQFVPRSKELVWPEEFTQRAFELARMANETEVDAGYMLAALIDLQPSAVGGFLDISHQKCDQLKARLSKLS